MLLSCGENLNGQKKRKIPVLNFFLNRKKNKRLVKLVKQTRNNIAHRLQYLFLKLLLILSLHVIAMMWFEKLPLNQAAWLTLTTVTTVGYGDISASSFWGQASTVVLLYILGIWMLAQLAGEYIDFRIDRRERITRGFWSWNRMNDHIVIVNAPDKNSEQFLQRLVAQFRATPSLAEKPVVLATHVFPQGLPKSLADMGVVYKNVNTSLGDFFSDVSINEASYVLFLAQDAFNPSSDSLTLDLLDQFERRGNNALVAAEAVQDSNFKRFKTMGADSVLRPIRAYPELIVRALSAPGTERILEDLFTHFGASIHRYDIDVKNKPWKDIACSLIQQEMGTPLGYIDDEGEVKTCPPEGAVISAKAILLMARDESIPQISSIESCIATA